MKKTLRDSGISVKKLKTADDKGHPVLRIADAVAGIARYRADNPSSTRINQLYEYFAKKVLVVIEK